jgi:hypothetical protein
LVNIRSAFSVFEFVAIREMDSLAPARSALAGLRLCQIPFTASQAVQVVSFLASWRLCVKICRFHAFPVVGRVSRSRNGVPGRWTPFPHGRTRFPPVLQAFPVKIMESPFRSLEFPVRRSAFPVARTPFPYPRTAFPPGWTPFPVKMTGVPVSRTPFPHGRTQFPVGRTRFPPGWHVSRPDLREFPFRHPGSRIACRGFRMLHRPSRAE